MFSLSRLLHFKYLTVYGWNARKRGAHRSRAILRAFKSRGQQPIVCFQEVPRWTTQRAAGFVIHSGRDSDCAIVVPANRERDIFFENSGSYWYGIVLLDIIILSVHLVDRVDFGIGHSTFEQVDLFIQQALRHPQLRGIRTHLIVCIDANTAVPPNVEGLTGPHVLLARKSHTALRQSMLLSWASQHRLRLANTFGQSGPDVSLDHL
jgi:hypothetical protein